MKWLVACGVIAAAVITAAPAHAEDHAGEYLRAVAQRMPVQYAQYGPQAILAEGYRICVYEHSGMRVRDETTQITWDLPMSRDEAYLLSLIAPVYLECNADG